MKAMLPNITTKPIKVTLCAEDAGEGMRLAQLGRRLRDADVWCAIDVNLGRVTVGIMWNDPHKGPGAQITTSADGCEEQRAVCIAAVRWYHQRMARNPPLITTTEAQDLMNTTKCMIEAEQARKGDGQS